MAEAARVALVTGGNRGLGRETCRQLAAQGYRVLLTSRSAAGGQAAADALRAAGGDVIFQPLDVTDADSVRRLAAYVDREIGRLDALINNAALNLDDGGDVLAVEPAIFQQTLEANLIGPLRMCQAFLPIMQRQNYGRLVNVSSGMGRWSDLDGGTPAYSLSKTALNALTVMLARRVQGTHILVNAVCPGWVRTDMGGPQATRSVEAGADTIVWAAQLPNSGPHGRLLHDRHPVTW